MELLRGHRGAIRIAHRGAGGENSLEAIEAAAGLGFDVVEIDVLRDPDGRLVVAHDATHAEAAPRLEDALALVGRLDLGVQLDLKGSGHERELAAAVRRNDLLGRSFASTPSLRSLRALRGAEPELARALTYPNDRLRLTGRRATRPLVEPGLAVLRRLLPLRLPRLLRSGGARAATLEASVVSGAAVERCHALGVAVYAWTVDDPALAATLLRLGVDGIITDDPRIFDGSRTDS